VVAVNGTRGPEEKVAIGAKDSVPGAPLFHLIAGGE
jgi:hypothetical protein